MQDNTAPQRTRSGLEKTAWVTGAGGFLGGAVLKALLQGGWNCVGLGHGADSSLFDGKVRCYRGTIDSGLLELAARDSRPDIVVHAAGGASVGFAAVDPQADFERSVLSTAAVVHFLGRHIPQVNLVFASSAAVYGVQPIGPISETAPVAPVSAYGWHKAIGEKLLEEGASLYGLRSVAVRFFSLYGPGLRKQLLWDTARRAFSGERPIVLGGTGDETRDFYFIDDAARLVARIAAASPVDGVTIVNGGSGRATSIAVAARMLLDALEFRDLQATFSGSIRAGDPKHLLSDVTRVLEFDPIGARDFGVGLQDCAKWMRHVLANA